jgi:hypothetical protein
LLHPHRSFESNYNITHGSFHADQLGAGILTPLARHFVLSTAETVDPADTEAVEGVPGHFLFLQKSFAQHKMSNNNDYCKLQ